MHFKQQAAEWKPMVDAMFLEPFRELKTATVFFHNLPLLPHSLIYFWGNRIMVKSNLVSRLLYLRDTVEKNIVRKLSK